MRVAGAIVLPTSAEGAWAILTDWERQSEWMRDAERVQLLSTGREGVGVLIAVRTRVFNIPAFTERLEVIDWDPPRRLRMAHRSAISGTGEWTLDPLPAGVRFTWTEDVSLPWGPAGRAALAAYRPFMRHLIAGTMRDLRRALVAARPGPH